MIVLVYCILSLFNCVPWCDECCWCTARDSCSVVRFMQSFNRPNLKYELKVKKAASINDEIVTLIKQKFTGQSGIIYCLSRSVSCFCFFSCRCFFFCIWLNCPKYMPLHVVCIFENVVEKCSSDLVALSQWWSATKYMLTCAARK